MKLEALNWPSNCCNGPNVACELVIWLKLKYGVGPTLKLSKSKSKLGPRKVGNTAGVGSKYVSAVYPIVLDILSTIF